MSWVADREFSADRPFGPQTLPYGVVDAGDGPLVAVRVGDHALPLRSIAEFLGELAALVSGGSLDPLLAAGRPAWTTLRARVQEEFH